MASQQYDISEAQKKILLEKAQRRAVLREQFLKLKTNPFIHASGEGGAMPDPGFLRHQALRVSGYDYFKPSPKNVLTGILYMVVPMFLFGYLVRRERYDREAAIRRGDIAYKDRYFKLF